jgi:hypothetical protein
LRDLPVMFFPKKGRHLCRPNLLEKGRYDEA